MNLDFGGPRLLRGLCADGNGGKVGRALVEATLESLNKAIQGHAAGQAPEDIRHAVQRQRHGAPRGFSVVRVSWGTGLGASLMSTPCAQPSPSGRGDESPLGRHGPGVDPMLHHQGAEGGRSRKSGQP